MRISQLLDEEDAEETSERGDRRDRDRDRAGRGRAARPRPLPAHRPRGPRRRRARLAARHAPPAHPARQGLGDVHGGEGVPAADRVPLPAAGGGLPRAAGRHGRPHRRSSSTAATSTACRSTSSPRATTSASTSTTTTTTPSSATSTWSTPAPPARPRSSTSWPSCSAAEITPEIASALYVGLVTDTGKFMYENTNAGTHRIAADLIEAGVEVDDTYRRLYEHVPIEKLRLLSRALDGIQRYCDDRLVLTYITAADYEASGAGEEMTEGIIDHLRSVEGAKVAALVRDQGERGPRRPQGQPALQRRRGRRLGDRPRPRAAAATSAPPASPPTSSSRSWSSSSAARSPPSSAPDMAGAARARCCSATSRPGITSHDMVRGCDASAAARRATPAPSTPSPPGCCSSCSGGRPASSASSPACRRPTWRPPRLGWRSSTGDPDGELTETGRLPSSLELPTGTGAPAGADDLGGAGRRRAPLPQGPPRRGGRDAGARGRGLPRRAARASERRRAPATRSNARPAPTSAP